MADPKRWQVGLVGYGEVGKILAEDLRTKEFARSADWRTEADRILAKIKREG